MDCGDNKKARILGGGRTNGGYEDSKLIPSMNSIVFIDDIAKPFVYDLYIKDLNGKGRATRLTTDGSCGSSSITVSPDGRYIAYVYRKRGDSSGKGGIRIVPTDGSKPWMLGEM